MIRFSKEIKGKRNSDNYSTPAKFYEKLIQEFNFDFDACPLNCEQDNLLVDWCGNVYINPPYSNIEPFLIKGIEEIKKGNANKCVFLIPARSDVRYWHNIIMKCASEIRFIKGRLNFNEMKTPAPFPCCLVIFDNSLNGIINYVSY